MSIYVCSDIHGLYDLYEAMLAAIGLTDTDHLYILGDMVDRGPDGIRILQDVATRPNVTCLIGNHEHMMWNYLNRKTIFEGGIWLHPGNGGRETLSRFKNLSPEDKAHVKKFISELYLQVEIEVEGTTFLLSHSSFLADRGTVRWCDCSVSGQDVSDVVWNSPWREFEYADPEYYRADGRYHVIGHVPVLRFDDRDWPQKVSPKMPQFYHDPKHRIVNIDLGCAMIPTIRANYARFGEVFAKQVALCVLDLEKFARGEEKPAIYIGIDGKASSLPLG